MSASKPMQGNADPKQDWQNRAARLQQLAEHQAVLICIHPQLFLVRLMFGLQGITNPKPRLLLSSLKEAKASWTADDPWLVITSELLQDSCGLDLIRWTKKQSSSVKAVLLLTENNSTSQAEALEAGTDAIVRSLSDSTSHPPQHEITFRPSCVESTSTAELRRLGQLQHQPAQPFCTARGLGGRTFSPR